VIETLKAACGRHGGNARVDRRDSLIGAGVMIAATILLTVLGVVLNRAGYEVSGEALKTTAFPASLFLSMPFTWTKGQPWKAQAVVIGGSLAILSVLGWLAARF
jgi:hypothetical protein